MVKKKSKIAHFIKRIIKKILANLFVTIISTLLLTLGAFLFNKFACTRNNIWHNRDSYKILTVRFNEICSDGGYDPGLVISNRLIDLNKKDNLNIEVYYLDYDILGIFNEDSAINKLDDYEADLIIYGTYKAESCNAEHDELCVNYKTSDNFEIDINIKDSTEQDYKFASLKDLEEGKLQGNIDYIVYWISALSDYKQKKFDQAINKFSYILNNLKLIDVKIYNKLSISYLENHNIDTAIYFNLNCIDLCKKTDNKAYWITSLNNLSVCYIYKNNYQQASEYNLEALKFCRENRIQHPNIGIIFDNAGKVSLELGDVERALQFSDLAIESNKNKSDKKPLIISYLNHSYILFKKQDSENAIKYFKMCLEEDKQGIFKSDYRFYYLGAQIYFKLKKYDVSNTYYKIAIDCLDSNETNYKYTRIAISEEIAGNFNKLANYSKALDFYDNEIMIPSLENIVRKPDERANIYFNYAILNENNFNKQKAKLFYLKAIKSFSQANIKNIKSAECYYYFAELFYDTQSHDSAIYYYTLAEQILLDIDKTNETLAMIYLGKGSSFLQSGLYDRSIPYSKNSINIFQNNSENDYQLLQAYYNITTCYYMKNEIDSAIYYCDSTERLLSSYKLVKNDTIGLCYLKLAEIYSIRNSEKALKAINKCIEIFNEYYPDNDPYVKAALELKDKINKNKI